MKNLYLALVLCLCFALQSCMISSSPNVDYFRKDNSGQTKYLSINMPLAFSKPYLRKALKDDGESEAVINLMKKMKKINVLTIADAKPELLSGFEKSIGDDRFEELFSMNNENDKVKIFARQNNKMIDKMMVTVQGPHEMVVIDIKGKFTFEDISAVINESESKDRKLSLK